MDNLEKLNKINNLLDIFTNVEELKEYIDVLIEIENEYK
jgi:DNA repair exonuclease SbcCD ATPase subunit